MKRLPVYLQLGRVSNLPTVWTNVLAGAVLSGAALHAPRLALVVVAVSLLYTAGMFLNDAYDRRFDAVHRPERPIARGLVSALEVFAVGYALLGCGTLMLATCGRAGWSGLALASAIVAYDVWHKSNPLSPLVMALCRALVYVTAALAASGHARALVFVGAALLFAYLVAVTWWAKRGGARVGDLLAGISLLDGAVMLVAGAPLVALAGVGGFILTRRWQRHVPGT